MCLLPQLMQDEVEQLQEKVNGLHSMVVVVDESNAESGKFNVLFADFGHVCSNKLPKCALDIVFL